MNHRILKRAAIAAAFLLTPAGAFAQHIEIGPGGIGIHDDHARPAVREHHDVIEEHHDEHRRVREHHDDRPVVNEHRREHRETRGHHD